MADEENIDKLDKQIEREAAALARANEKAKAALVPIDGAHGVAMAQSAEAARQQLAKLRAEAMKAQAQIEKRTQKLRELQRAKVRALENRMRRELANMETMMGPLKDQLDQLNEMVWTVSLYLGREEQIVQLLEGTPAPADEQIAVRQMVLAMDQECAVASEDGGIDSLNYELFDAWLQADPAHVEQVIPERKGVVALVPRYNTDPKFYADAALMEEAMEGNAQTYFLIRNGDNLYRTWTDFKAGYHLIPKTDEFTSYFRRRKASWEKGPEYLPLEPGSKQWVEAEKAASYRQRHFMRVGLILEGLLHRTTVFHPLPESSTEPSFMDAQSHEAGHVRFLHDAERTLAAGDLEPFDKYLGNLVGQLRKGMRIIGNFSGQRFSHVNRLDEYGEYDRKAKAQRIHPARAERPDSGVIYQIEDQKPNGDLIIRYRRTETVYPSGSWGYKPSYVPKTRASCIIRPGDDFVIPLDLVDVPTMQRYLSSRLERHTYTTMFPVLKRAIAAKQAEERVEKPFRELLVQVMVREAGCEEQTAREHLPALVDWYKLGNRIHRPLVTGDREALLAAGVDEADVELVMPEGAPGVDEGKAVRLIVAEFKRRLKDTTAKVHEQTVEGLRELHRDAVLIARTRSGRYIVLTPEEPKAHVWVRERQYTAGGALREDKRWVLPGTRVQRWTVLWASERWSQWDLGATRKDHLSGPERERFVELARDMWEQKYDNVQKRARENDYDSVTGLPAGIVLSDDHKRVVIFALGYDWRFGYNGGHRRRPLPEDNASIATGTPGILTAPEVGPPEPAFHFWQYEWARKGEQITVQITDHGQSGWEGGYGAFTDDNERERKAPPWSMGYHRTRDCTVVYEDEVQLNQFFTLKDAELKHVERVEELETRVHELMQSIVQQWLQPRYDALWRKFLDEYQDPDLWHGHVKAKRLPEFPHKGDGMYALDGDECYLRALRALVEQGEEPWGMTVAEAVALAQEDERFNYVYTHDETHRERRVSEAEAENLDNVTEHWDDDDAKHYTVEESLPVKSWKRATPPRDIAALRFDKDFELVEPWPEAPKDDDLAGYCEECGDELDDEGFCATCAAEDEGEDDGEDFDVEGTVEEGVAALPSGETD